MLSMNVLWVDDVLESYYEKIITNVLDKMTNRKGNSS